MLEENNNCPKPDSQHEIGTVPPWPLPFPQTAAWDIDFQEAVLLALGGQNQPNYQDLSQATCCLGFCVYRMLSHITEQ